MRSVLNAEHIAVRFGNYIAVEDVSFHLRAGDWLMLAGPNGAGKSTLVNALAQTVPYSGRFLLMGQDIRTLRPAALAREIGVLSQRNRLEIYQSEKAMLEMVRQGDINYFSAFSRSSSLSLGVPVHGKDPLRQMKTSVTVFTTLVTRAGRAVIL